MSRRSSGQKAARVLEFLLALRNPRISTALASFGFGPSDVDEGWNLLRALGPVRFDAPLPTPASNELGELERWMGRWLPIARAALARHVPEIGTRLFQKLPRASGPEAPLAAALFLDFLASFAKGDEREHEAFQLLVRRGLNDETVGRARELLERLQRPARGPYVDPEPLRREIAGAEARVWQWYLEWSRVARTAVTDRRLLRQLGFAPVKVNASRDTPETRE